MKKNRKLNTHIYFIPPVVQAYFRFHISIQIRQIEKSEKSIVLLILIENEIIKCQKVNLYIVVYVRGRNNELERALPRLKSAIHDQRMALDAIHSFMEQRDNQMKEEITLILAHVRSTCELEIKGSTSLF